MHRITVESEWLPAMNAADLAPGSAMPVRLCGHDVLLWRSASGVAHAWRDRCPHRGAKLSLGHVQGETLACGYHGWVFGPDARCTHMPSQPEFVPPASACATAYRLAERYGVIWVCLGEPAVPLEDIFPEYERPGVRRIGMAPQVLDTSAPRLVENFLDMAHFPYVHAGTLGDAARAEVADYSVHIAPRGPVATGCRFWQPSATPGLGRGAEIEYVYALRGPMLATLTKLPSDGQGDTLHILLLIAPIEECRIRAWLVSVFEGDVQSSDEALHDFNHAIFMQDVPIVESQEPKRLPLDPAAELHQRCDRMAMAYRRWLRDVGWSYGTLGAGQAD